MRIDKNQIITIPNLLSLLRLLLIPVFMLFYLNGEEGWTATLLILSGLTDVIDGVIARKLNQISDVGKVFNPIADKLTQALMFLCLIKHFSMMLIPFLILVAKALFTVVSGLIVVRRPCIVPGAAWQTKNHHAVWNDDRSCGLAGYSRVGVEYA